ncbi:MAG: KHG/KDPG aldolase [Nitrosomonadaceae bacterium]|nr:KHG/KDPG aldolase [Nitrosomonadaceae bacterium]
MAKYSRMTVLANMLADGLVPIFYHPEIEVATRIVAACFEGGARCIEFANRGSQTNRVFQQLIDRFETPNGPALGIGTILNSTTAAIYLEAGANFIVGPTFTAETARLCNRRKVAYLLGCCTVSEIAQAEEMGVEICKLFPGSLGGPAFVKAVRGPMPLTRLMPAGGVEATEECVKDWFEAGAACVGIGNSLISNEAVERGDFSMITQQVQRVLGWIQASRGQIESSLADTI